MTNLEVVAACIAFLVIFSLMGIVFLTQPNKDY